MQTSFDVDALIAVLQSENVNVEIKKTVAKKAISLEKSSEVNYSDLRLKP